MGNPLYSQLGKSATELGQSGRAVAELMGNPTAQRNAAIFLKALPEMLMNRVGTEFNQLRLPFTVPKGAINSSTGKSIRPGTSWSVKQNPPIPEGTMGSRPSITGTRIAPEGQMNMFTETPPPSSASRSAYNPTLERTGSRPSMGGTRPAVPLDSLNRISNLEAGPGEILGSFRQSTPLLRPTTMPEGVPMNLRPSPTPAWTTSNPFVGPLETAAQLGNRDPGTLASIDNLATQLSDSTGVPFETVRNGLISRNSQAFMNKLQGGVAEIGRPVDVLDEAARIRGSRVGTRPSSLNFVPETAAPDINAGAMGGVRVGNLGALAALLGGSAATGFALSSQFGSEEPSLGQTTTQGPPSSAADGGASFYDDRVISYTDPSAGPVNIRLDGARASAVQELSQQYARGQGTQDTRASKPSALQAQYAQEGLKARANIGEIINELGYNAPDKAPLRQWAVQNPALAMRLFEQQQIDTAKANNLQFRDSFPTQEEITLGGRDVSQQSPGTVFSKMTNTAFGSNFGNNTEGYINYKLNAAVDPSNQGAQDIADAATPLNQPTMLPYESYMNQAPERKFDTEQIAAEMINKALALRPRML